MCRKLVQNRLYIPLERISFNTDTRLTLAMAIPSYGQEVSEDEQKAMFATHVGRGTTSQL